MSKELYAMQALATLQAVSLYRGKRDDPKMMFHCAEAALRLQNAFEKRHVPVAPKSEEELNRYLHEFGMRVLDVCRALGLHGGEPSVWSGEELQKQIEAFDPDDPAWGDSGFHFSA